jgi:hypothetical protein
MILVALPIIGLVAFAAWRLRQSDRITIRSAGLVTALGVFSFFLLAGSPTDSHPGESALAGAIVGLLAGSGVVAYLLIWRRLGGTIRGRRISW